jgi:HSP20 family protein
MNLTLWNKRSPVNGDLDRLRNEMDRTFDRFFNEPLGLVEPKTLRAEGWIPPVDVSETDTEVTIRAEVPGIAAKDLDISVSGNTLTIAGQKQQQEEKKGEDFYRWERSFGSFRRFIELPDTVDASKVTAESDNGVVTIQVAKKPGVKPRQVEVKPAGSMVKRVPVTG